MKKIKIRKDIWKQIKIIHERRAALQLSMSDFSDTSFRLEKDKWVLLNKNYPKVDFKKARLDNERGVILVLDEEGG